MKRTWYQRDAAVAAGLVAGGTDRRTWLQYGSFVEPELHQNSTANRLTMPLPRYNNRGETLIEIVMAVVIIGLIFSSFFAAVGTTAALSASHRNLVSADTVLRDSAEAVKAAVRANCPTSTSFTTTTLATEPAASSSTNQCPVDATHVRQVDLSYTTLGGANEKLSIEIRTP